jgi:hypothetical protein
MNQTHITPFLVLKQIVQFWKANYNGRNESSEEGEDASFGERLNVWSDEDRWKQEISVKTLYGKIILIRYDRTESHTLGSWIKHLLSNKERDINHQMFNFLFNGVAIADLKHRIQEIKGKPIYSQRFVSTKILEDDEPILFDVVKYDIHLCDRLRGPARTKLQARYEEDYDPNYETKKGGDLLLGMEKITTQTTNKTKGSEKHDDRYHHSHHHQTTDQYHQPIPQRKCQR